MKKQVASRKSSGFSLIEVVLAVLIIAVVSISVLRGLAFSAQAGYHASLGSTALYRCQEKIEEILDTPFLLIDQQRYPAEVNLVLDTRGTIDESDDVFFNRFVQVMDESNGNHLIKRVTVTVTWRVAELQDTRQITTMVAREGR